MAFTDLHQWISEYPLLEKIIKLKPVTWINPSRKRMTEITSLPVNQHDMQEAELLWQRFAPYLAKAFPELKETKGVIESPLREIANLKKIFSGDPAFQMDGDFFLKCDSELPVAGSIKARGGIFEVLHYAEELATQNGLLSGVENYEIFDSEKFKQFFQQYSIGVGSTGNLGLSIGIISAKLGFNVSVYMSADAKEWKKKLLRSKGANVLEFAGDFGEAITEGRRATHADPKGYFVDDENSKYLFLGYSVAATRLKQQLDEQSIRVDEQHPLFVYSPCGVGGSPGGVAFGLRQVFGDCVHCFFVEPTHSPGVLIGLLTGKMEKVSVHDFGIDNRTEADGLAVGRPSAFATSISKWLISGVYTIEDDDLFRLLYLLAKSENIFIEPSATAGLAGPHAIAATDYIAQHRINPSQITHIAWATGGAFVPTEERDDFYQKGKALYAPTLK
ncbi:MAG: D-serine ammonia-lyase [Cytophagales bacterium]|jgi:D-serine dehydratase|nr:D-serine ammonia-lyase [Bacteroidota bacterium]MBS1982084.1 D-serine ammonia-lyase [Bacteroidota bacterium]WHZ06444.1 MAG: D-serine ammonia-lyase [Cytophagales bacterium]